MKGFLTAFSLECKKVFSSKGFWIFAVVILILCLIVTVSFRTLGDMLQGMDNSALTGSVSAAEMADMYRVELDEYYALVESGDLKIEASTTTETYLKNMIALYDYLDENGIKPDRITTLGAIGSINMSSGDYVVMMSMIVSAFVAIMAIVLAARAVAGETNDGTMRMQLTRPVKRSVLLTAKTGAVFVTSLVLSVVLNVLFMVIGAIFFDGASHEVLLIDAYQNIAVINPYAAIFLLTLFNAVTLAVLVQFTVFVGNFASKSAALAIPLVLFLFADTIASLLYDTWIPFVGLFTNLSWATALTPAGAPIRGMSIYTMIAVTTVWFAGMTAVNYIAFEKRDFK